MSAFTFAEIVANLLAVASVILWRTKQIPRLIAALTTVVALVAPALVHATTIVGVMLPLIATLWITGVGKWVFQQWRTQQKGRPPTGKQREHLNADWTPKRTYSAQSDAEAVAQRQGQQEGRTLDAYQCDVCKQWHVGHAFPGSRR